MNQDSIKKLEHIKAKLMVIQYYISDNMNKFTKIHEDIQRKSDYYFTRVERMIKDIDKIIKEMK